MKRQRYRRAVFVFARGKAPPMETGRDCYDFIVRNLHCRQKGRPGEQEGESRDAHPRLTLDSPRSRDASAKAAR